MQSIFYIGSNNEQIGKFINNKKFITIDNKTLNFEDEDDYMLISVKPPSILGKRKNVFDSPSESNTFPFLSNRREFRTYVLISELKNAIEENDIDKIIKLLGLRAIAICQEIKDKEKFLEYLNKGQTAQVFNIKDKGFENFVLKRVNIGTFNMRTDLMKNGIVSDPFTQETLISALVSNLYKIHKGFILYEGFFYCPEVQEDVPSPERIKGYSLIQKMDGVLRDWLLRNKITYEVLKNIIFQLIFAINTMQKVYGMVHYDMHYNNIGISLISDDIKYLRFVWDKTEYLIPNIGILIRIFDFDTSYIDKPIRLASQHLYIGYKSANMKAEFRPGYDIGFILGNLIRDYQQASTILLNGYEDLLENRISKNPSQLKEIVINTKKDFDKFYKAKLLLKTSSSTTIYMIDIELNDNKKISDMFSSIIKNIYEITGSKNKEIIDFTEFDNILKDKDGEPIFDKNQNYILADKNNIPIKKNDQFVRINENSNNKLFFGYYKRPTEILANADLTKLLSGDYFNEYKEKKVGKILDIANVI